MESTTTPTHRQKCRLLYLAGFSITIIVFYYITSANQMLNNSKSLSVWTKPDERVKRPVFMNRDHGLCGRCPPEKHGSDVWQLVDLIDKINPTTKYMVNIGAASSGGGQYDPTYPVLVGNHSFGALLIDPNPDPKLFDAYPVRNNIQIKHDYIWPESIVKDVLEKYRVEKQFGLLKVDIDSYECSLIDSILKADYRPDIIHTEFNPIFAPPVVFIPIYDPAKKHDWNPPLWANHGPFYGCSLSALVKTVSKYDYVLLQVEFWDTVFIRKELAISKSIQVPVNEIVAYQVGYMEHSCLPHCKTNLKLYNQEIDLAIKKNILNEKFRLLMSPLIDQIAPKSKNTNEAHPYVIET